MNETSLRSLLNKLSITPLSVTAAGWMVCRCPFAFITHRSGNDESPSFTIKIEDNGLSAFNCFSCHEHGNMLKLVKLLGKMREKNYDEVYQWVAVEEVVGDFGEFDAVRERIEPPAELDELSLVGMYPLAAESSEAKKYLMHRGIGKKTTEHIGLLFDDYQKRILFPVRTQSGGLLGFSGRSIMRDSELEQLGYPRIRDYGGLKKAKSILGAHDVRKGMPKLVVEGLFAYASVLEMGGRKVCDPVSTLGSTLSSFQRDMLVDWDCPVIMCYDQDLAGAEGLYGPINRAGSHKGNGALDKLHKHVPTSVFAYANKSDDIDDLEYEDLIKGIKNSKTY